MRFALLLAPVAAMGACYRDSPPTILQSTAPAPRPDPFADPLALLPASSNVIFIVDFAKLRETKLFANHRKVLRDKLVPRFAACQYDPFDDITLVTVAITMGADGPETMVVRGLDREKTLACLRMSNAGTDNEAVFDGDVVAVRNLKSSQVHLIRFVGPRTAVLQGSKTPSKEVFAAALKIGAPLRADESFGGLMGGLEPGAAASIIVRADSPGVAGPITAYVGASIHAATLTLHTSDASADGRLAIDVTDAATAAPISDKTRAILAQEGFDRFDVRVEGTRVIADFHMGEAYLQALEALIAARP